MDKPAINDWLERHCPICGKVNGLKVFQHYELMLTKTSGIFCGFGCPGSQDNMTLLELLVSL